MGTIGQGPIGSGAIGGAGSSGGSGGGSSSSILNVRGQSGMTLDQIFNWCNKKSYYSRDDEDIWQAINGAARLLYNEAVIENKGFFIVFDTTSLVIAAGQQEYTLPATLEQIVRLRERLNATEPWRTIAPADMNAAETLAAYFLTVDSALSPFIYNGPYQKLSDEEANNFVNTIRLEPAPTDTRATELVYTGKFVEISGNDSPLIIDPSGHTALCNLAVVELMDMNDDDAREKFLERGNYHKTQWLKLVRARQVQSGKQQEPYLYDLD
jgi:hypothetical protein